MSFIRDHYKNLLTILVVFLMVWYFSANLESFKPILEINPIYLIVVALIDVMLLFFNGLFLKFIVEPFKKRLTFRESTYVSVVSSIGNFFAPAGGGLGFRAVYLKTKHNLSYANYLSTLSGNYVIVFLCTSFFGLISLFALSGFGNARFTPILLVFLVIFVGSIITMLLPPISEKQLGRIKQTKIKRFVSLLNQVANGWDVIKKDNKLITKLVLVTIASFAATCLITKLIAVSLGIDISFSGVVLMSSLGALSFIINVTPANFGVKESIYAFSATIIGITGPQALSIALVDRGVLFFIMVIMWALTSRLKSIRGEKK